VKSTLSAKTGTALAGGEWFLNSGIQEPDGGVARYYFSDRNANAPVSTEITGYFASALIALYQETADGRFLDAAVDASAYLEEAWDADCGAMPFECAPGIPRQSFFFDSGIIVRGLLAVWRECGRPSALSAAIQCADSMAQDFANGEHFSPILELPGKSQRNYEAARWSRSPGCYQLKAALAWRQLWEVTKEERYHKLYRQVLEASLATHSSFLPACDGPPVMDRLHAYSYFLEGLLPALDEPACKAALAEGIDRVTFFIRELSPAFLRSDVVAQLLRVRLFAEHHGIQALDEDTAQEEAQTLQDFQSDEVDPHLNGGFWFGRKDGTLLPFMNPVSTAFCYQALEMWKGRGRAPLHWQSLI
jgi:hypothetical protein